MKATRKIALAALLLPAFSMFGQEQKALKTNTTKLEVEHVKRSELKEEKVMLNERAGRVELKKAAKRQQLKATEKDTKAPQLQERTREEKKKSERL